MDVSFSITSPVKALEQDRVISRECFWKKRRLE
jgi:hypothetical protein